MEDKIRLGVSACLLGEKVRYDGSHKRDRYVTDTLSQYVEFVPVCPEEECGFGIPRETLRLEGDPRNPRLITTQTRVDYTDRMTRWAANRVRELEKEDLCGFIFKSKSPSSGMERVKVYTAKGMPAKKGVGMFARAFMAHFPLIPVEEDGRMHDPQLRENFIERIFAYNRWQAFKQNDGRIRDLVAFHADHKLLVLSHSPKHYTALGKLVAAAKTYKPVRLHAEYLATLMDGLGVLATVKKNTNVLQHMMGYLKKRLSADEKQELLGILGNYQAGLIPLIVPITIFRHYVRKYDVSYLTRQLYLNPHPLELMLRNHV